MLRWLFLIIGSTLIFSYASKNSTQNIRKNIYESCYEKLKGSYGKSGEDYCNCAADIIIQIKSGEELIRLENDLTSGAVSTDDIIALVQPCVEQLSEELYNNAAD